MSKKILIIEDDPVMGLVCQRLLGNCGFETDLAKDGASGIERLPNFQPDAVFLDLMMPKVNGIKVLEWIRAQESFRNLPVIVLTNAAVPMLLEQAAKSGATHILDKSKFNPVAITELLRGLLNLGPSDTKGVMSQSEPWKPLAA
jgi:two-component system, response regulator